MLRFFRKNKYVEEASQYAFDKEGQIPAAHCHYYGRKWPVGTESKTAENCWT